MNGRTLLRVAVAVVLLVGVLVGPQSRPATAAECAPSDPGRSAVVLLVHGQGSSPDAWTTGAAPLAAALSSATDVVTVPVDLTGGGSSWVTDDLVGPLLARTIACWSTASFAAHGPGQVVVVTEGTAGWAVRCALDDDCGGVTRLADAVGKVVTIGDPVDGLALADVDGTVTPTDPAWPVCRALTGSARPTGPALAAACQQWEGWATADDAEALVPGSDEIADLPPWPADLDRHAIDGTAAESGSLFGTPLPDTSIADGSREDGDPVGQTVDCGSWALTTTDAGTDLTGGVCWPTTLAADPQVTPLVVGAVTDWATAHRCGIDLTAPEVSAAIDRVPVFADYPWDRDYLTGTFDRCATLSGVSLSIQGATASSPMQVMLFHRGEYVGTGTGDSYRSTYVDAEASTDDTVVVDYVYARPWDGTTASAAGEASIRFQWDGEAVAMLDELPLYLADPSAPAVIGLDGFGPFRWGDSRASAEAALITTFSLQDLGLGCAQAELEGFQMPVFGVQDGRVTVGAVFAGTTVVTDTGIAIGDPESRIAQAYPDATVSPDPSDAYSARWLVDDDGRVGQFIAYDGVVQYMQFGLAGSVGEAPCV